MELKIDYEYIATIVQAIHNDINSSNVTADYTSLLSAFTESKGEQIEACRDLLRAERTLSEQIDSTFGKFANKIQVVADEFKQLDQSMANQSTDRNLVNRIVN
jgi:hypothetical protein